MNAARPAIRVFAALLPALVITALAAIPAAAQSILGLKLGAPESALGSLGLAAADSIVTPKMSIRGYDLPDGGRFEVVVDRAENAIVFLQHSRLGAQESSAGDLPGTTYGRTTLAELRARFGSNGFVYHGSPRPDVVGDRFVLTNAYDLEGGGAQPLVAVFLTSLPVEQAKRFASGNEADAKAMGEIAVLSGVILARRSYVETVWGSERMADKACRPVAWAAAGAK